MPVTPAPTARKAVANLVSAVSGWSLFAIFTGPHSVSWAEWGFLVSILTGAFLGWYVPNDLPAPWTPRARGDAGEGAIDLLIKVVALLILLLFLWAFWHRLDGDPETMRHLITKGR